MLSNLVDKPYSTLLGVLLLFFYPFCAYFLQRHFSRKLILNLPADPSTAVEELWRRKSEIKFSLLMASIPFLLVSIVGALILLYSFPEDNSGGWYFIGLCLFVLVVFLVNHLSGYESNKMLRGDTWTKSQMLKLLLSVQLFFNTYSVSLILSISVIAIVQSQMSHDAKFLVLQVLGAVILFVGSVFGLSKFAHRLIGYSRVDAPDIVENFDIMCDGVGINKPKLLALDTLGGNLAFGFALSNAIVVSNYLLRSLSLTEMRALLAHELAHIVLGHMRKRAIFFGITGLLIVSSVALATSLLPSVGGFRILGYSIIVWYLALKLSQSIFRQQEYAADKYAADLIGDATQLSAMLEKLHLLAFLPKGEAEGTPKTHPTMDDRASALRQDSD